SVSNFLGLTQSTVGLLFMVVLVGMGERMAERFLPIYLLALGGGAISIGLLNGLDNFLSAVYAFSGGYVSERIGFKRSLLVFNGMAMAGFLVVILIPAWQAVLIGAVFFLAWSAISLPATMGLIARVLPINKRTMGVTMHSLVRRFPMALGPILGGLCIGVWGVEQGIRIAFAVALSLAVLAVLLQQKLIEDDTRFASSDDGELRPEKNPWKLFQSMDASLKRLLISDILIRFCEQIPYAFVVVWCMQTIARPVTAFQFGLLTAIEMATAVFVYIPVAQLADKTTKKPFVVATFVFFTFFPLVLLFCQSFGWLIPAFVLRGLKEFGEPTRKALILDLAPKTCKAGMYGLYYFMRDACVSVAAFGGALLWQISPVTNLTVAFAFGVAGTIAFARYGTDVRLVNE
ncbi:MAG: MFS transporter, partial [Desulfobacterales bacterium]